MASSAKTAGDASPVRLEVIAPTLQGLGICTACELMMAEAEVGRPPTERALEDYPPEWQADWQRLTEWVYDLAGRYGNHIVIKVIDPQSAEGLLKSVRHRVRHYPTWVVDGRTRIVGWEREALEAALQRHQERRGV